jgi:hypothetical protein
MKNIQQIIIAFLLAPAISYSQTDSSGISTFKKPGEKSALIRYLNPDSSQYFQATFSNQVWLRFNENNPGTTRFGRNSPSTFDIGLRRTRIQLFGQVTARTFLYFQFGQNNFNSAFNLTGNRKLAAFFHDALCEYRVSSGSQLKIGAGLTAMNGLSRFSQPSVSTILTLDVPVFLQYSVDQIDQFDRRLAVYARGQLGKLDYRLYMSDPFPINSNGSPPPALSENASFVDITAASNGRGVGVKNQFGGYAAWNFFESEPHNTTYMTGTYLGNKKIFNIAVGGVHQSNATWRLARDANGIYSDTSYSDMLLVSIESFIDLPLNSEKGTALNAFAGYYNTNYGKNYLRYAGSMNPGTGSTATNLVQNSAFGNTFPMFGTGHVIYSQFGFLLPKNTLGEKNGKLMPFISAQFADYKALQNKGMLLWDLGVNWLIKGHNSKFSLDYQNRPTFYYDAVNVIKPGPRKSAIILQYQIFI